MTGDKKRLSGNGIVLTCSLCPGKSGWQS